jgi:cysteinyl-tRNA synthetase
MLSRLYDALEKASVMEGDEDADKAAKELGDDALTVLALGRGFAVKLYAAGDQDFNTAQALAHVFELARALNRFAAHKKAKKRGRPVVTPALAAFALVRDALGLFTMTPGEFHAEVKAKRLAALGLDRAMVEAKLAERAAARQSKDWAKSDAIRDELAAHKVEVLDLAEGVDWRVKLD